MASTKILEQKYINKYGGYFKWLFTKHSDPIYVPVGVKTFPSRDGMSVLCPYVDKTLQIIFIKAELNTPESIFPLAYDEYVDTFCHKRNGKYYLNRIK